MLTGYLNIKKLNVCPQRPLPTKYLHMQSTELCLASSKILTPHPPPLHPKSVSSLRTKGGGIHSTLAGRWGGGGSIFWSARHWIGLLQYNPPTSKTHLVPTGFLLSSILAVYKVLLKLSVRGRLFSQTYLTVMFFDNYSVKNIFF